MTDPLSLAEARELAGTADTILLRATRTADLETPIGAFLRLDDGVTPAYLLESVEGGERLGRYSFLGVGRVGCSRSATAAHTPRRVPWASPTTRPICPSRSPRRRTRWPRCARSSPSVACCRRTACPGSRAAPSAP